MRGLFGAFIGRTRVVCLLVGFLSGLLTMNIFSRGTLDRWQGARQVIQTQQQLGDALVDGGEDHRQEYGDHGHLHDAGHDHNNDHDDMGKKAESLGARLSDSCTYTWMAVANRHVIGSQHDPQSHTVEDCQAACVNRTDCSGVDFNRYHNCFMIIDGSSGTTDFHHRAQAKHEEDIGCVHYDLTKSCGSAADDDTLAQVMNRAVRVLCWVMTTPKNHMSKAIHIQATWGRRCTKLLFVTEKDDVAALSSFRVEVETGRKHLATKTMSAFQHIYEHHINDAEWFFKADDDTYVIMENLRFFLSSKDHSEPVYFGQHFIHVNRQDYTSGGSGYVLSKEALARFGKKHKGICRNDGQGEDLAIGECMQKFGVRLGDSRDALGRSRFHCFNPQAHIHGIFAKWYLRFDKYGAQKGIESISDYAISFHYITAQELYNFEFHVYHLRPYGIISRHQDLNRHDRVVQKTTKQSGISANSDPLSAGNQRNSTKTSGSDDLRLTKSAMSLL